jgi:hypothetical protein
MKLSITRLPILSMTAKSQPLAVLHKKTKQEGVVLTLFNNCIGKRRKGGSGLVFADVLLMSGFHINVGGLYVTKSQM